MGLVKRIGMILAAGVLAATTACDSLCVDRRTRLVQRPDATAPVSVSDADVLEADAGRPEPPRDPQVDICDHFNNDIDGRVDEDGPCQKFVYVEWKEDGTAPLTIKAADSGVTRTFSLHKLNGWPAWSPDAQWIAYASADEGIPLRFYQSNVFIMRADGQKVQQLTDKPAHYHSLAFSPDGRLLAFFSDRDQGGETRSMTRDLYVIDMETKQLTRLTFHKEEELWRCPSLPQQLSWSRDSTKLVYACDVGEQVLGEERSGVTFGGQGVVRSLVYDITQRRERMLAHRHAESPVFSPVDDRIALIGYRNERNELVLTTASGEPWRYITENQKNTDLSYVTWSPNGKALAYVRSTQTREPFTVLDNVYSMYLESPRGDEGRQRQVTFHENEFRVPYVSVNGLGWSPSDDWLLYTATVSADFAPPPDLFHHTHLLRVHEGRLTLKYVTERGGVVTPRWAPFIADPAQPEEKKN